MAEQKTRKPAALVAAEKRIIELEEKLKQEQDYKAMYQRQNAELDSIVNGIHDILDDVGIRAYRDDNKYSRIPLAARLFAWAMKVNIKE